MFIANTVLRVTKYQVEIRIIDNFNKTHVYARLKGPSDDNESWQLRSAAVNDKTTSAVRLSV